MGRCFDYYYYYYYYYHYYNLGWKVQSSIFGNVRKAFFWENIRNSLILEPKKSIEWKKRNFLGADCFQFSRLGLKVALGSCILYYKHTCLCNQVYFFEKLQTEYDFDNLNCFCYKFKFFEQIMKWFDSLFWLLNTKSNFQKLKDR